jgi:cephalosporin hydroxylase
MKPTGPDQDDGGRPGESRRGSRDSGAAPADRSPGLRPFRTGLPAGFLAAYQTGNLAYEYRGVPCLKSPIDLAVHLRLLWKERPATIFEIGSNAGGSALFFADVATVYGFDCRVVSIDLVPPTDRPDCEVRLLEGNVRNLGPTFLNNDLFSLARPWLVVEDSEHSYEACLAALEFFRRHLSRGELLVIEDGVLAELGLSEHYDGGPNRAIEAFFERHPTAFEVATEYTDMFGVNVTYNPNGYLRRRDGEGSAPQSDEFTRQG